MPNEVKLEAYTFGVRKSRNSRSNDEDQSVYENLSVFDGENDLYDFYTSYLQHLDIEMQSIDTIKRSIRLKPGSLRANSGHGVLKGIFESGRYGYGSEFRNILDTNDSIRKSPNHAEQIPFYFLIYVPRDSNIGVVLLQRFGIEGVNSPFRASIKRFFKQSYPDYLLDISSLISKELIRSFIEEGNIKEIIFRRYSLSADAVNSMNMHTYREDLKGVEFRILSKNKKYFTGLNRDIIRFMRGRNRTFLDIPELHNLGFDGTHKISIVSDHSGTSRTIDISETGKLRPYYDIDEEVEKDENSHPLFDSIDQIALGLLQDFLAESLAI